MVEEEYIAKNCDELIISLNIGPISITAKSTRKDANNLSKLLDAALDAAKNNEQKIKDLVKGLSTYEISEIKSVSANSVPSAAKPVPANLSNIVEIFDNAVKFTSKKAFDLTNSEAIALLMYAMNKPLRPIEIANLLTGGWKKITDNSVSVYFTDEKKNLKQFVVKTDEGYILTGAGKNWVENVVLPKLD